MGNNPSKLTSLAPRLTKCFGRPFWSMSPELLEILVCPRSKKKLQLADTATLEKINTLIKAGKCREISGAAISETASEALLQKETGILYFIRDGIPVLIYENAVELK